MFEIISIDELLRRLDNYSHTELHVHHTWKPEHSDFNGSNGIALQEAMRNFHVNTNGWQDIGQHVTLLPDGLFVTGRDFGTTPASIAGYNTGAFACETLGNFDIGHDVLQGAQKENLLKLARYFYDKGRYIRFHNEDSAKTCPGTSIDKNVFMKEVESLGKKYYVVTGYLPETIYGVEMNAIYKKYFSTLDRWYIKHDEKGVWIETQYLGKYEAEVIADKLKTDSLLGKLVEE